MNRNHILYLRLTDMGTTYISIELTVFLVIGIDLIGRYRPTTILDQVQDTNIYLVK